MSTEPSFVVTYLMMPIACMLILGAILNRNRHRTVINVLTDVGAAGLTLLFGIMICFLSIANVFFSDYQINKDRLYLDYHVYSLMGNNTYDDLGYGTFVLYNCHPSGWYYSKIHETKTYYTGDPASLALDSETQSLSIIVNGDVAYTTHIQS